MKNREMASLTVPLGSYFVLGDNRDRSLDSRELGCVPAGDLVGYPELIFWPAHSWARFGPGRE